MKRKLATIGFLLLTAMVTGGGCCLTNSLWASARDQPRGVVRAWIAENHVLHIGVRHESGRTRLVAAVLEPGSEWIHPVGVDVGAYADPRTPPEGVVDVDYVCYRGKDGTEEHTVWVDERGYQAVVDLPAPLGFKPRWLALATLATPFAVLVDVVTYPLYVTWIVFTAGGHGPCWLPWCDRDS